MTTQLKGNGVSNWFYNFGLALVPHVPNPLNARMENWKLLYYPKRVLLTVLGAFFWGVIMKWS